MDIGRGKIAVTAERDPAKLPWRRLGVDVALECTGIFTRREAAAKHLEAGARRVIISAPADGVDMTVVLGVNHDELRPAHEIISNGSCTTNCLAPVAYVLHQGIGIERGYMTTIHSYTGDQSLQDTLHSDLRRARAAALALIPTSTGAARAVGLVLPALKGKLDGTAIRVPTANVSLIDFKFDAARETSSDEVNGLMEDAAKSNRLKGIVGINKAPTVSVDFNHDPHSSTFDVTQNSGSRWTLCPGPRLVRQRMGLLEPHGRSCQLFRRDGLDPNAGDPLGRSSSGGRAAAGPDMRASPHARTGPSDPAIRRRPGPAPWRRSCSRC